MMTEPGRRKTARKAKESQEHPRPPAGETARQPDSGLLSLQRAAGNQAVGELLQNGPESGPGKPVSPDLDSTGPSGGRPLSPTTRTGLKASFGRDLSRVRVHTGPQATEVADQHQAYAVTEGQDIYFAGDAYQPDSVEGRALLAHEVAHTAQASQPGSRTPTSENLLENEASLAGLQAAVGMPAPLQQAAAPGPHALSRKGRAGLGAGIGAAAGLLAGAAGLGFAALAGVTLGAGAILGALFAGAALGAGLGALIGYFKKRTRPVTPEESDLLIRGRYGDNLTKAIADNVKAEGTVKVVGDDEFKAAYVAYTGSEEDSELIEAFVDRSTTPPTIWIHRDREAPDTVLHEAIHIYSNPAFRTTYGKNVNEGTTEYFSRQILIEQNIQIEGSYEDEYQEIRALVEVAGEDALRKAYFEGDLAALEQAVDNARSEGVFATWLAEMQAGRWSEARKALEPEE
jgi:hypothetical protein